MKTSIAQTSSTFSSISSEVVSLSFDADVLEALQAAIETSSDCASAMMLVSDNNDVG